MEKHILVVGLNCSDRAREEEFNAWYNDIHLPDVLETPGFIQATRWEHNDPKQGDAKFLALYEIESDDVAATMKELQDNLAAKTAAGRMNNLGSLVLMGVYRQIKSVKRAPKRKEVNTRTSRSKPAGSAAKTRPTKR